MALPLGELARERLRGRNWHARKLCTSAVNCAAAAKSRPLGEGGIAAGDDGRGLRTLPKKPEKFLSFCVNGVILHRIALAG